MYTFIYVHAHQVCNPYPKSLTLTLALTPILTYPNPKMSAGTASANVRDSAPYICRGAFVCEGAFVEGNVVINEGVSSPDLKPNLIILSLAVLSCSID